MSTATATPVSGAPRAQKSESWPMARLGDVCRIMAGFGFPKNLQGKTEGDVAFFKVGDISEAWKRKETYLTKANHYLSKAEAEGIKARPFPANTTVFAKIGAAIALNRRAMLAEPSLVDNNVMGLFPATDALDEKFLFHFACTLKLGEIARATTVPSVRKSDIEEILIPLPPLDEQRRIVEEIEQQFTRLDAGVAALRSAQTKLKRYRAAVLKAACEGKLVPTEAELARREGRGYECGEELLKRILAERRKKWSGLGKYKEPLVPASLNSALPEGWSWATLDALAEVKGGITKDQKKKHTGPVRNVPYLRVANVQRGYIDLAEVKEIAASEEKIRELALKAGDILFNEGGDRDKLGRGWVWQAELPECIHQNHVFRARPYSSDLQPKFFSWYSNTAGQSFFFDEGKHTTNLASISLTKLKGLPVPVPPTTEQARIVDKIERHLSVIDELEAIVRVKLHRASRLRHSILQARLAGTPKSKRP